MPPLFEADRENKVREALGVTLEQQALSAFIGRSLRNIYNTALNLHEKGRMQNDLATRSTLEQIELHSRSLANALIRLQKGDTNGVQLDYFFQHAVQEGYAGRVIKSGDDRRSHFSELVQEECSNVQNALKAMSAAVDRVIRGQRPKAQQLSLPEKFRPRRKRSGRPFRYDHDTIEYGVALLLLAMEAVTNDNPRELTNRTRAVANAVFADLPDAIRPASADELRRGIKSNLDGLRRLHLQGSLEGVARSDALIQDVAKLSGLRDWAPEWESMIDHVLELFYREFCLLAELSG